MFWKYCFHHVTILICYQILPFLLLCMNVWSWNDKMFYKVVDLTPRFWGYSFYAWPWFYDPCYPQTPVECSKLMPCEVSTPFLVVFSPVSTCSWCVRISIDLPKWKNLVNWNICWVISWVKVIKILFSRCPNFFWYQVCVMKVMWYINYCVASI